MKRTFVVFALILVFACTIISIGHSISKNELEYALMDYVKVVERDLPDDLRLTIYYLSPGILTRVPLSSEEMINHSHTKRIIVESEQLETQLKLLRELNPSILQPVEGERRINTRLYYVIETEGDKLLEVDLTKISGTVFVNGIEVEDHPIFFELIKPFMTEEAYNLLGIQIE